MKQFILLFTAIICSKLSHTQTMVTLSPDEKAPTISKHIYGHFAEHLGRNIYDGFYVGEESNISNTEGVRNDIITALKELNIPNLRWPGGCFADTYHWKDGIGPEEERPTMVNQWWGGVTEDNRFGTHNFLNLCEELGAEPYLAANVGSGTVKELADWVQYVNHDGVSPMAKLRRENGRENPWNVTFWGIGNEMWGCGGNMTPEYYANLYRQYATFMGDWNNSAGLYRIASGASDDDYHWTEVLMRDVPNNLIEGVALHSYSVIDWNDKGPDVDFNENHYFQTMQKALRMEELITRHVEIMDKYDPAKEVDLIVDEWGGWYNVAEGTNPGFLYQQNTMRDAMIAGSTLNIFNNHSDRVKMANLAQTVNVLQAVILTSNEQMILTPTYHVMNMYKVHQDAQLIPVEIQSPLYSYKGESLPALSVSASKNKKGTVHISVTNIDMHKEQTLEIDLSAIEADNFQGTVLTSEAIQDYNSFEKPETVTPGQFDNFTLKNDHLSLTIPAFSVVVLKGTN